MREFGHCELQTTRSAPCGIIQDGNVTQVGVDSDSGRLGELMGWPSNSTVCAAEGRRNGRQRGFTTHEVERLAAIFGLSPAQLTMECANCGGHPADRVRLPDLRSPAPDMKPEFAGRP